MPTVLVVEDSEINRLLFHDVLEEGGYQVIEAASAPEAIEKARQEHPDLILMDIGLPGMDGFEAARVLKADPSTRSIPIIALSGYTSGRDQRRAMMAGFDSYLAKPVEMAVLLSQVANLIAANAQE